MYLTLMAALLIKMIMKGPCTGQCPWNRVVEIFLIHIPAECMRDDVEFELLTHLLVFLTAVVVEGVSHLGFFGSRFYS